ncbi:heavy-metal-associated domain-containing protein [Jatrophihabitans sp. DSM 45814]
MNDTNNATHIYRVSGMTCQHCVSAVTEELVGLPSVATVDINLVPDGISTVTIGSAGELSPATISGALDAAGGYVLTEVGA